ncbi:MAG TPA: ECF-type sigma factor [Burkholderiaceae bacterium]|nr:ECF-type sigma factor [Burkholderiaceae bacterium]
MEQERSPDPQLGARVASAIRAADDGDPRAAEQLFAALYAELHRMAKRQLHRNASGSTLGATTLLHEAYLDIAARDPGFPDRARFFAYTARAMRGLIIDHVRERRALKRGGEFHLTALNTEIAESTSKLSDLVPLGDALNELARIDAPLAELVDLKFFCGFSFSDIAAMRGVSERTVQRDWNKARLYLRHTLHTD